MTGLDLRADVVDLTAAICDIPSVSGDEKELADAVEAALRELSHLRVVRDGDAIVARTDLGRDERVLLAGHLDTVPLADPPNLPTRRITEDGADVLWGRGTVDMLGGVAAQLALAARVDAPNRDITFVFYDNEEVESSRNGLGRLARTHPDLLNADLAVLLEPTNGIVEGGCKGTLRFEVTAYGVAAHSGRPWMGANAIHRLAPLLAALAAYEAREVDVDGLVYREGLSAVGIRGGAGNNVVPDTATVTINYRFAPDITADEAIARMRAFVDGVAGLDLGGQAEGDQGYAGQAPRETFRVTDAADGARPGLGTPAARAFVDALGVEVAAKQGWTDVARFTAFGIPAVNYGPGDPLLAHKADERCPVSQYRDVVEALTRWLSTAAD